MRKEIVQFSYLTYFIISVTNQHGVTVPPAAAAFFQIIAVDKQAATTAAILDTNTKPVLLNTR